MIYATSLDVFNKDIMYVFNQFGNTTGYIKKVSSYYLSFSAFLGEKTFEDIEQAKKHAAYTKPIKCRPEKQYLIDITIEAKVHMSDLKIFNIPINSMLIELFHESDDYSDFDTPLGWLKKGYRIRGKERGFPIWKRNLTIINEFTLSKERFVYVYASEQVELI